MERWVGIILHDKLCLHPVVTNCLINCSNVGARAAEFLLGSFHSLPTCDYSEDGVRDHASLSLKGK